MSTCSVTGGGGGGGGVGHEVMAYWGAQTEKFPNGYNSGESFNIGEVGEGRK